MKAKGTVGNTHKKKKIEKNTTLYLHIFSYRLVNAVEGTDCKGKEKLWISAWKWERGCERMTGKSSSYG